MPRRVSVLCSGGMDSVFLAQEAHESEDVELHSLLYVLTDIPALGMEMNAVEETAARLQVPLCVIDAALDTALMRTGNEARVVPGRNLAFVALAVNAVGADVDAIWLGCTADDNDDYPDCRQAFIRELNDLCSMTYGVQVEAPFICSTKHQILAERSLKHNSPRATIE